MKRTAFIGIVALAILCVGCIHSGKNHRTMSSKDTILSIGDDGDSIKDFDVIRKTADTLRNIQTGNDNGWNGKGLNEIRFANFKDKDWLGNDYIRCLRAYLDEYNSGNIIDESLDPYRDKVKGKFVIGKAEPFIAGGMFILFIFVDSPETIFSTWIYSDVDDETETVTGYSLRGIKYEDGNSGFTKDELLDLVKKHPELKLW